MRYRVRQMKWITRSFVREHRDHIFLFGENLARRGFGGQAAQMRSEPNAIGIPTKKLPSNVEEAFFTDAELEQNKAAIDRAFNRLSRMSSAVEQVIVMPATASVPGEHNSKTEHHLPSLTCKGVCEIFLHKRRNPVTSTRLHLCLRGIFKPE